MRSGTNDEFYKRGNVGTTDGTMYLSVSHPTFTSNQVLLGTKYDATMGRDALYDAEQGYEGELPPVSLMTMIGRRGYVIQGIPPVAKDTEEEIPLYLHTSYDGVHTFQVNKMEQFSGYTMYIEDRVKGTRTEIRPGMSHSVRMMKGDYLGRFYLVLENGTNANPKVQNIADRVVQSNLQITPIGGGVVTYQSEHHLTIDAMAADADISSVEVYDMAGKMVYASSGLRNKTISIDHTNLSIGVYVIHVNLSDGEVLSAKFPLAR
ncbi:MAG TPA: hypothetical protein DDX92_07885 [Flavobacteriales bacterium]|nr:hypothetical protein [Flavobacteriales bacterium]